MFKNTNSVTLCQNSVFAKLWGCQNEEKSAFFVVVSFYVGEIETEKEMHKMDKGRKAYKNSVFKVGIQKCEESKKERFFFPKNCRTLFVSRMERNTRFRAHYLFCQKFFGDQSSVNQETLLK